MGRPTVETKITIIEFISGIQCTFKGRGLVYAVGSVTVHRLRVRNGPHIGGVQRVSACGVTEVYRVQTARTYLIMQSAVSRYSR